MRKGFLFFAFSIFLFYGAWAPSTKADVGDFGAPFWAMNVGNSWDYSGDNLGNPGPWSYRTEVTGPDTTTIPGVRTFVHREREDGVDWERNYFSISLAELRLWRMDLYEDVAIPPYWVTITINGGAILIKNPIVVGDQWTESKSGTYNGQGTAITVVVTVLSQELVQVPAGAYNAYKIRWDFNNGAFIRERWFVPFLGFVKRQDGSSPDIDVEMLTAAQVERGGPAEISAYHLPTNQFFSLSGGNLGQYGWGASDSMPLVWDSNGDGIPDVSFYHIPTNQWFVKGYPGDNLGQYGWGMDDCVPVPGDYDGTGAMKRAFYHLPTNRWFVEGAGAVEFGWGGADCIPLPGDYDGDGKTDMVIYHIPSNQWFMYGVGNLGQFGWGGADCIPVPADYTGDGSLEIAVYHIPSSQWFVRGIGNLGQFGWGGSDSFPIPEDYDGSGSVERGFYRPLENRWFVEGSGDLYWGWGGQDFMPITSQTTAYNWFRFKLGIFQ